MNNFVTINVKVESVSRSSPTKQSAAAMFVKANIRYRHIQTKFEL